VKAVDTSLADEEQVVSYEELSPKRKKEQKKNEDLDEILMGLWKYTGDKMKTLF
jgi:hypothetical protein